MSWPLCLVTLNIKDNHWDSLCTVALSEQVACVGNIQWGQPETWTLW